MDIFILHKSDEKVSEKRISDLSQFGKVILCSDQDEVKDGFKNLCSGDPFPNVTSWDTAFSRLSDEPRDTWFFENDVRWGNAALPLLFRLSSSKHEELISFQYKSRAEQPNWYWWKVYAHHFQNPFRSFNPVCRLRESLIQKVLEFRSEHEGFVFHELLFPSLTSSCFDLETTNLMGAEFRWRPPIKTEEMQNDFKLFHPVKDDDSQGAR